MSATQLIFFGMISLPFVLAAAWALSPPDKDETT